MVRSILVKFAAASVLFFAASSVQAQEDMSTKKEAHAKGDNSENKAFMESLSDEQKQAYKSLKEQKKSSKKTFDEMLSPEQLAIADNKMMDKKAKKDALKATYTDAQKQQLKVNREANKSAKEAFEATLSEEQKALMPKGKGMKGDKKGMKKE